MDAPFEYLMHRLGMPVSDDTILRQLKRNHPASIQNDNIRVVGIDDWSWRHSSRYGTIMVDLERHSVVDVLDRSVEGAKAWLRERAGGFRNTDRLSGFLSVTVSPDNAEVYGSPGMIVATAKMNTAAITGAKVELGNEVST
jgi:hypothetical protein